MCASHHGRTILANAHFRDMIAVVDGTRRRLLIVHRAPHQATVPSNGIVLGFIGVGALLTDSGHVNSGGVSGCCTFVFSHVGDRNVSLTVDEIGIRFLSDSGKVGVASDLMLQVQDGLLLNNSL